ncbi:ALQxL family class IV lanthipeptide [Kitasatospora sp. NPDC004240]
MELDLDALERLPAEEEQTGPCSYTCRVTCPYTSPDAS